MRFALAETDPQLEKTLNTFLCPILLKLASPVEAVRSKVPFLSNFIYLPLYSLHSIDA